MKNTTASAISAPLKARALVFRTKPMTPAASTATPSAKGSHVGYWPTLSEKNPLITALNPLVIGTVFGYVSSSRTIQTMTVQKMTQFRKRRGIMPAPLGRGSST